MNDTTLFTTDPRSYALELVHEGMVDPQTLLEACLAYMSHDDVRDMLAANEMAPEELEDDFEYEDEDEFSVDENDFNNPASSAHY
jgi:hypothetical protein